MRAGKVPSSTNTQEEGLKQYTIEVDIDVEELFEVTSDEEEDINLAS